MFISIPDPHGTPHIAYLPASPTVTPRTAIAPLTLVQRRVHLHPRDQVDLDQTAEVHLVDVIHDLQAHGHQVSQQFINRQPLVDLLILGLLTGENVFVLGQPGVSKTKVFDTFARGFIAPPTATIQGAHIVQMNAAITDAELFGPTDVLELKQGRWVRRVGGVANTYIAGLDEVFRAGDTVLNLLLAYMNERVINNGAEARYPVPTLIVVGTSNSIPTDESLMAFYDRFGLRMEVRGVEESHLHLIFGASAGRIPITPTLHPEAVLLTSGVVEFLGMQFGQQLAANATPALQTLNQTLRQLRARVLEQGHALSDRRWARIPILLVAQALLNGRTTPTVEDFTALIPLFWQEPESGAALTADILALADPLHREYRDLTALKEALTTNMQALRDGTASAALMRETNLKLDAFRDKLKQFRTLDGADDYDLESHEGLLSDLTQEINQQLMSQLFGNNVQPLAPR